MMEKEFIPYEQALELKELGFDELCFGWYDSENQDIINYDRTTNSCGWLNGSHCSASTFSQAFRWFRDKYGLYFSIQYFQYDEWCLQITTRKEDTVFNYKSIDGFKYYEEAELACLKKLIEIAKNEL